MKITFAKATAVDLPQIVAIYNQAIPGHRATADLAPVTVAQRQAWFAAHDPVRRPLWLLIAAGQVVGWVGLEDFYGRAAYAHTAELSLYLADQAQGQGVGQQALDFVVTQLPRLEVTTLLAYVFGHNQASQHLFRKNGFTPWAHLPGVALLAGRSRDLDILGRHFTSGTKPQDQPE